MSPHMRRRAMAAIALLAVLLAGCSDAHTDAEKQWADDGIDPRRTTLLVPRSIETGIDRLVGEFTAEFPEERIIVAVRELDAGYDDVADTRVPTIWIDMVENLDRAGEGGTTVPLGHTPLVQVFPRGDGTPPPLSLFSEKRSETGICDESEPCSAPGRELLSRLGAGGSDGRLVDTSWNVAEGVVDGEITTGLVDSMTATGRYLRVGRAEIPDAADLAMPVAARTFGPSGGSTKLLDWLGESAQAGRLLANMGIVRDPADPTG